MSTRELGIQGGTTDKNMELVPENCGINAATRLRAGRPPRELREMFDGKAGR